MPLAASAWAGPAGQPVRDGAHATDVRELWAGRRFRRRLASGAGCGWHGFGCDRLVEPVLQQPVLVHFVRGWRGVCRLRRCLRCRRRCSRLCRRDHSGPFGADRVDVVVGPARLCLQLRVAVGLHRQVHFQLGTPFGLGLQLDGSLGWPSLVLRLRSRQTWVDSSSSSPSPFSVKLPWSGANVDRRVVVVVIVVVVVGVVASSSSSSVRRLRHVLLALQASCGPSGRLCGRCGRRRMGLTVRLLVRRPVQVRREQVPLRLSVGEPLPRKDHGDHEEERHPEIRPAPAAAAEGGGGRGRGGRGRRGRRRRGPARAPRAGGLGAASARWHEGGLGITARRRRIQPWRTRTEPTPTAAANERAARPPPPPAGPDRAAGSPWQPNPPWSVTTGSRGHICPRDQIIT